MFGSPLLQISLVTDRNPGQWNAYVSAGSDKEERKKRLAEVPEAMRGDVERHVRTVFAIKNYHRKNKK